MPPSLPAGAFYLRLVGKPMEVYQYLEPLYNDYRRIRLRTAEGAFTLTHVDELVDQMLRSDYLFDIALPRVPNRCPVPAHSPGMLELVGQLARQQGLASGRHAACAEQAACASLSERHPAC